MSHHAAAPGIESYHLEKSSKPEAEAKPNISPTESRNPQQMTRSPGHKRHKTSAAQQTVLQRANEMFMTPVSDDEAGQLVQDAPGTSADFQYSHSSSVTESEENAQSLALNANLSNATIFEVAPRVTVLQNEECEPHDLSTRRQLITTEAPGYKNLASNVIPLPTARQISKVKKGRKEYRCEHPGCNKVCYRALTVRHII